MHVCAGNISSQWFLHAKTIWAEAFAACLPVESSRASHKLSTPTAASHCVCVCAESVCVCVQQPHAGAGGDEALMLANTELSCAHNQHTRPLFVYILPRMATNYHEKKKLWDSWGIIIANKGLLVSRAPFVFAPRMMILYFVLLQPDACSPIAVLM